jgi:putative addiction module component (TIGR02574 family)
LKELKITGVAMALPPNDIRIDHLTIQERLDLIALIWDSIVEKPEALPIPEWHREELDRRLAGSDANSAAGVPWEEVKERLRGQL